MLDKELLKGSIIVLILNLLDKESMYGYQMIKEMKDRSKGMFDWKEGTLYPVLHAMEKKEWIEAYWVDPVGGRKRKYYRITDAGKGELKKREQEWQVFSRTMRLVLGGGLA